jgi:NAD(P)H-hydrate epimerase
MAGAAYMTAQSALLAGAGKVTLAVPKSIHRTLAIKLNEVMTLPLSETRCGSVGATAVGEVVKLLHKVNVVAIGPGLGLSESTKIFVKSIIKLAKCHVVLDADGINCISDDPSILIKAKKSIVLTPHEGEFRRVSKISRELIKKSRKLVAKKFSTDYHCTLVLKGYRTVVSEPGGLSYVNHTGNPGMATAGAGDVLTGITASFIAQGFDTYFASCLAVYVHALAGDRVAKKKGETSLIATDLINEIPFVLRYLEKKRNLEKLVK